MDPSFEIEVHRINSRAQMQAEVIREANLQQHR